MSLFVESRANGGGVVWFQGLDDRLDDRLVTSRLVRPSLPQVPRPIPAARRAVGRSAVRFKSGRALRVVALVGKGLEPRDLAPGREERGHVCLKLPALPVLRCLAVAPKHRASNVGVVGRLLRLGLRPALAHGCSAAERPTLPAVAGRFAVAGPGGSVPAQAAWATCPACAPAGSRSLPTPRAVAPRPARLVGCWDRVRCATGSGAWLRLP